jgi:hypothetical protein
MFSFNNPFGSPTGSFASQRMSDPNMGPQQFGQQSQMGASPAWGSGYSGGQQNAGGSWGGGYGGGFMPQMQSPYGPSQQFQPPMQGGFGGFGRDNGAGGSPSYSAFSSGAAQGGFGGQQGGFGGYGGQQGGFGGFGQQQGFGGYGQQQGFGGGFGGYGQQQGFGGGFGGGFNPYQQQMQSPYGPQQGGMMGGFGGPQMRSPYGPPQGYGYQNQPMGRGYPSPMGGGRGYDNMDRGYGRGMDRQVGNQGMGGYGRGMGKYDLQQGRQPGNGRNDLPPGFWNDIPQSMTMDMPQLYDDMNRPRGLDDTLAVEATPTPPMVQQQQPQRDPRQSPSAPIPQPRPHAQQLGQASQSPWANEAAPEGQEVRYGLGGKYYVPKGTPYNPAMD